MNRVFNILSAFVVLNALGNVCTENRISAGFSTVHFLEPGSIVENNRQGLRIFCHRARSKYFIDIWKTLTLSLNTNIEDYDLYDGKTSQEVEAKHEDNQRSWRFNLFGTKKSKELKINPFEDTCIGVYVQSYDSCGYTMTMSQTRIDVWKLLSTALGITLFCSARKLSKNSLFYYLCGITLGVTTSLVILMYFFSKLLPKGKVLYVMVATGWTVYLAQALWHNAQLIIMQYRDWVMWYILVTSLISFVICYRFGPVTNQRTKKIIQWFLQVLGLVIIYYSSHFQEASASCCITLVLLYNFPIVVVQKGKKYWQRMFPERRRLLTDDEFRKEGVRETGKALYELQQYCSSPECNPWKTVLRLKDPIRFARFMEGDSHLSDDELEEHDKEITRIVEECEYTDDDDDL